MRGRERTGRCEVILVHRLKGEPMFVNADLIESIEARPDTVLTLVDGRKTVVAERPEQVVDRVREFRAAILVTVEELRSGGAAETPGPAAEGEQSTPLVLLRGDEE